MSTDIAPMQAFTERLRAALRDDVARMMPDEVLQQMIQSVIREGFFEGVKTEHRHGGGYSITPPKFHAMIMEALEPLIKERVAALLQERAADIDKALNDAIQVGVIKTLVSNMDTVLAQVWEQQSANWSFQNAVVEALRRQGYMRR